MQANRLPALAAAALLLATGALHAQEERRNGNAGGNPIPHEPLLVYQASGPASDGTAQGGRLELLMIYDDGSATLIRQQDVGPAKVARADAGSRAALLMTELRRAGAMRLPDRARQAPELPMTTVTAFAYRGGSGHADANSFSYSVADGSYAPVEEAVHSFLADVFGPY